LPAVASSVSIGAGVFAVEDSAEIKQRCDSVQCDVSDRGWIS